MDFESQNDALNSSYSDSNKRIYLKFEETCQLIESAKTITEKKV